MPEASAPGLHEPFATPQQQREAATLGMWAFLGSEIMLFGGLIFTYVVYRHLDPAGFAEASRETHWIIGTVNTAVLLTSSLTMALGVRSARMGARKPLVVFLATTALLGLVFLGLKGVEYFLEYQEHLVPGLNFYTADAHPRAVEMFYLLYFLMTGLHALHLTIGIGVMGVLAYFSWKGRYSPEYHTPVEIGGLYWHLVDIVWVFLFPIIYLVQRGG